MFNNYDKESKCIVFAATSMELMPFEGMFDEGVELIITGVGAVNTVMSVMSILEHENVSCMVQVGIAGSLTRDLRVGQSVVVERDVQADLGAMREGGRFEPFRSQSPVLSCDWITDDLFQDMDSKPELVYAQSVNLACSGIDMGVEGTRIETMEGAAFFSVAHEHGLPFLQLRTISNYVDSPRSQWDICGSVRQLSDFVSVINRFAAQNRVER